MVREDAVNILLVDDQPAKLLSYETILSGLGERLVKASSAREAFQQLLKYEFAVVLVDVCMPELDGFELGQLIRDHPRCQRTAIIFISAVLVADVDRLRAYEMGAVDYVPVPVVPEVLRAKVKVFVELFRKTKQLELLNAELEQRVSERTHELEASNARLLESEEQLRLATEAAEVGLWDVNNVSDTLFWPPRVKAMFGIPVDSPVTLEDFYAGLHPEDKEATIAAFQAACDPAKRSLYDVEYRTVGRDDGEIRWVAAKGRAIFDSEGRCIRVVGTAIDVTKRKAAEEQQSLLAREVDHRAKNVLALVQSMLRLTRANNVADYIKAVDGRIHALARSHNVLARTRWQGADIKVLIEEELQPYAAGDNAQISLNGPSVILRQPVPQALSLTVHELATNAAKYGALSTAEGHLRVSWDVRDGGIELLWTERGGSPYGSPGPEGFGIRVIRRSVEQLKGRAEFDWRAEGLICRLSFPLVDILHSTSAKRSVPAVRHEAVKQEGLRVLVIEDESLIALMIAQELSDWGHLVHGPFRSIAEALPIATEAELDAAVLDINLGGDLVYPIANVLRERGVPIIFLTGYEADSVQPGYPNARILHKPIAISELRDALETIAASFRSPVIGCRA